MIRIVKMTFRPEQVQVFEAMFHERRHLIAGFPGCSFLALVRDKSDGRIFFTISRWDDEAALENYRNSELFKSTWALTKVHFDAPAEAWSVDPQFQSVGLF